MSNVIQPLPKKQRVGVHSAPENSNNQQQLEAESRSLYFDILPENSLDNILRFRSRSPSALNWPNHTLLEDIIHLYDVHGELASFMLARFTGVYVIPDFSQYIELTLNDIGVTNEGTIVCTTAFLLTFIRSGRVIPSFISIFVGYLLQLDVIGNCRFDLLSKQWPNISRLIFLDGSQGNWFEKFGKDLEYLYVLGSHDGSLTTMKIAAYCTKLRHLAIKNVHWEGIDPAKFWKRVGKYLETVCARFDQENEGHTHYITKYCPNIKRLELLGNNDGIPECIAFYGEKIEEAKIDFSAESDLKLLISSCPNARFSLWIGSRRNLRMALDILGPQLKALEFRDFDSGQHSDELHVDWSSCTNLESVKFYSYPRIEDMRCFMEKPKYLLKCFEFIVGPDVVKKEELQEFISLLSRGTGSLEKIVFSFHEPSLGLFNSLVEKNRNLSYVKIYFSRLLPNVKKMDIMETFLKCPSLKKLYLGDMAHTNIYNIPGFQDLRRSIRHRRIRISAFGTILI